jgi:4,5:9,10-diseco-3-hydroxy-5,9,17-trioxoandrosta-1(10),2-diene-4-oate hydrolase
MIATTLEPFRHAVGAPEPVIWIDAGGTRLAVMRRGRGVPVLCLHAIGHGARDFEALADRVGDQYEIVALDWPGQGRSPHDEKPPPAARYATLALAAMDALGLERAILLGNSIGGAAALRLAAAAPDRVSALVLCNAGGLAPLTGFTRFAIGRMAAFFRAGEERRGWFAPAFRFYYRRLVLPRARTEADRIIAAGYEIAPLLRQAWESFARPDADIRALTVQVTCPVLLAWARSDRIIPWSGSRRATRGFRDRTVALFRGGHSAFLEDPDRFAATFRKFLRSRVRA